MDIQTYLKQIDEVIEKGPFKDNWESLSAFQMPDWYQKGRFGLFIHWGVYSQPAVESEWYPRLCYIKGHKSYHHRVNAYGPQADYRQLVEQFNPQNFDADAWVDLFQKSGAKYIMPVGEHHDGVKMYQSDLNRWNMAELAPKRDFLAELHTACDKKGIGFLTSSHRAEHYWFFNGARKFCPDSEVAQNKYPDLYGPAYMPPSGNIDKTDKEITPTKEWLEDWLASSCEMIDKTKPLAIYFDWWVQKNEFRPYMKKFMAYYYNRGVEWGKQVAVFYKWGAVMKGCAIFDVERGQIDAVAPELWQNDTAIAKNSWGYTEGNRFKTPCEIICNLIEVISKNGCYMLNVGPKADGTVCEEEKNVLLAIGQWMKANGEAIYDSRPFEVGYGEGKKKKAGSFKEAYRFTKKDYRFTYKPGSIYVFPMATANQKEYVITSLRHSNEGGIRYQIKDVELLGYSNKVRFSQDEKALRLRVENMPEHDLPLCFKVHVD